MIDQNSQFFAILTAVGEAKQANATSLGQPWTFAQMGVGDANLTDPIPNRTQTRLINEWRRAPVNQVRTDPANPNIIITEQVIPADVGGKWIREIALYDADGDMVAVANCAPSFKPLLVQGTGKTQIIRMNFIVANTASVVLKIDPAVVLATREYVDTSVIEVFAKADTKQSVRVATTANIVLTGTQSIDGVAVVAGDRVLVRAQTAAKENGIYVVAAGAWSRAADANTSERVTPCLNVAVEEGTANSGSIWLLVTKAPIVLGTTALVFEQVRGRTGVIAGSYKQLTVDIFGRVLAGTNPTTLAGFGILDAFTKTESGAAIQKAVADLVNSSPGALDTLRELATALGDDPNFATTMTNALAGKAAKATSLAGYGIIPATQEDAEAASNFDNSRPSTMLRVYQFFAKRLTKSPFDATPGLITVTGDAGWGANGTPLAAVVADADAWTVSGSARTGPAWIGSPYPGSQGRNQGTLLHQCGFTDVTYASQLFLGIAADNIWFRRKTANVWQPPVEVYTTASFGAATTAASGIVELATAAETIAGTDPVRAVTPAGLAAAYTRKAQCTAWVNFNGAGTIAIRDSYNCLSITDNGTGDYTFNWLNQTNAFYSYSNGTSVVGGVSGGSLRINESAIIYTATQLRLCNGSGTSGISDCVHGSVQIFGGQ
jgi:phage-related tail fiber protein